ncbi:MAG: O-antigen ligase family protein [Thermoleophilaceae bacterium]
MAATPARTNSAIRIATLWVAAVALLLAPAALAFNSGGFFYKPQDFGGIAAFALLGLVALAAPWPLIDRGAPLVALGALAGLALWTGLSISWARVLGMATDDTDRVVLYTALFALALVVFRERRIRAVAPELLLLGITVVALYALAGRLLPHVVPTTEIGRAGSRLAQPLTYWNAEGIFLATGVLLGVALAADEARPRLIRALACGAAVPCAFGGFLTFSRGAGAALLGGLLVLFFMRPRRATLQAIFVAGAGGALLCVLLVAFPAVRALDRGVSSQASQGAVLTAIAVVVAVAAGLLHSRLADPDPSPFIAVPRGRLLAVLTVPLVLGAAVGLSLSAEQTPNLPSSASRLVTFEANRKGYWKVALEAFKDHPLNGVGTASFAVEWRRKRTNSDFAVDAHSLYLETLAELGIVGGLLLAALYAAVVTGLRRSARAAPEDATIAAAAAVLAAFAIHAGVDWDWEMPAATLPTLIMAAVAVQRGPWGAHRMEP